MLFWGEGEEGREKNPDCVILKLFIFKFVF